MNNLNPVLREALEESRPSEDEIRRINLAVKDFVDKLKRNLKKLKIDAEPFVGGSFAKKTLVKKEKYDIDIYVRFDKKYRRENLSELLHKALGKLSLGRIEKVHGSRDYFKVNAESWFYLEVVPVLKISKPQDADNITDLSYYHVRYINKKLRNTKIADEIILAKRFCHAQRVYGAESHIKGFSGYAIELLVYYYGGFVKLLKAVSKIKSGNERIIIDIERLYRNKNQIMLDMNSSKLESPIILVDPTYKQRNAIATLSNETFEKFRMAAMSFLKDPKIDDFRIKDIDFSSIKRAAKAKKCEFLMLDISTNKQEGAIAGSKLLKFYDHLAFVISRYFEIKDKGFYYTNEKDANCYFIAKKKNGGKELVRGPPISRKSDIAKFKKRHKKTYTKKGFIYAEERMRLNLEGFVKSWKDKNKKLIGDMYITEVKIID